MKSEFLENFTAYLERRNIDAKAIPTHVMDYLDDAMQGRKNKISELVKEKLFLVEKNNQLMHQLENMAEHLAANRLKLNELEQKVTFLPQNVT